MHKKILCGTPARMLPSSTSRTTSESLLTMSLHLNKLPRLCGNQCADLSRNKPTSRHAQVRGVAGANRCAHTHQPKGIRPQHFLEGSTRVQVGRMHSKVTCRLRRPPHEVDLVDRKAVRVVLLWHPPARVGTRLAEESVQSETVLIMQIAGSLLRLTPAEAEYGLRRLLPSSCLPRRHWSSSGSCARALRELCFMMRASFAANSVMCDVNLLLGVDVASFRQGVVDHAVWPSEARRKELDFTVRQRESQTGHGLSEAPPKMRGDVRAASTRPP